MVADNKSKIMITTKINELRDNKGYRLYPEQYENWRKVVKSVDYICHYCYSRDFYIYIYFIKGHSYWELVMNN